MRQEESGEWKALKEHRPNAKQHSKAEEGNVKGEVRHSLRAFISIHNINNEERDNKNHELMIQVTRIHEVGSSPPVSG